MGGDPAHRSTARARITVALAVLAAVLLATADAQEAPSRPEIFRGTASARVASMELDRSGLLPIDGVLEFIAIDGDGFYEPSVQAAQASLLFPGNGVVAGPSLLCGEFGDQFPDELAPILDACLALEYPLVVRADPLEPDRRTAGSADLGEPGDPVSLRATGASARATAEATTTTAEVTDLRVLGLPGGSPVDLGLIGSVLPLPALGGLDTTVLTIDSATASTDQRISEAGILEVEATATLNGVRLVGGLVEIGAIRSRSAVTDDGRGRQTHEAHLEVSGVSVAGVPARVDQDGLTLEDTASGPLVQQLAPVVNDLVRALGIRIEVLDVASEVGDDGIATARAEGLLLEFSVDIDVLPTVPGPIGDIDLNGTYLGALRLGTTGVNGVASFVDPFDPLVQGPQGPDHAARGVPAGTADRPAAPDAPALAVAPPARDSTLTDAGQRITTTRPVPLVGDLRWLYLVMTLSALGLCISPRVALPARLGRRHW